MIEKRQLKKWLNLSTNIVAQINSLADVCEVSPSEYLESVLIDALNDKVDRLNASSDKKWGQEVKARYLEGKKRYLKNSQSISVLFK